MVQPSILVVLQASGERWEESGSASPAPARQDQEWAQRATAPFPSNHFRRAGALLTSLSRLSGVPSCVQRRGGRGVSSARRGGAAAALSCCSGRGRHRVWPAACKLTKSTSCVPSSRSTMLSASSSAQERGPAHSHARAAGHPLSPLCRRRRRRQLHRLHSPLSPPPPPSVVKSGRPSRSRSCWLRAGTRAGGIAQSAAPRISRAGRGLKEPRRPLPAPGQLPAGATRRSSLSSTPSPSSSESRPSGVCVCGARAVGAASAHRLPIAPYRANRAHMHAAPSASPQTPQAKGTKKACPIEVEVVVCGRQGSAGPFLVTKPRMHAAHRIAGDSAHEMPSPAALHLHLWHRSCRRCRRLRHRAGGAEALWLA